MFCIASDLLRIDTYSFNAFAQWFFDTHFISPLQISGSNSKPVQSVKYSAGRKSDAVNYVTSRRQTVYNFSSFRERSLNWSTYNLYRLTTGVRCQTKFW